MVQAPQNIYLGRKHAVKSGFGVRILKYADAMERWLAVAILAAASIGGILLLRNTAGTLITAPDAFSVSAFLSKALMIVMGVEFVRMLTLHTARAVINVLLFAIARQMIVSHGGGAETLMGVAAVAGIFAIKKYLFLRDSHWDTDSLSLEEEPGHGD